MAGNLSVMSMFMNEHQTRTLSLLCRGYRCGGTRSMTLLLETSITLKQKMKAPTPTNRITPLELIMPTRKLQLFVFNSFTFLLINLIASQVFFLAYFKENVSSRYKVKFH